MKKQNYMILAILAVLLVCAGTALAASGTGAAKNPDYPTKAITYIMNVSAGSATDLASRALCAEAEKILGVPIAVINKTGGSGTVGNAELAMARNDGYTLGTTTRSTLAVIPHQIEVPYTYKDFDYICTFAEPGFGLVVPADSPFKTVKDVLEAARVPGGLGCAASGYPQPVTMQQLSAKYNCQLNYVPFTSGADVVTALLGGHVKVSIITQAEGSPYVQSGQFRLLGSASGHRWPVKPEIPTLIEQGFEIFPCTTYLITSAPVGVEKYKLEILRKAFKEAWDKPVFQDVLAKLTYAATYVPGDKVQPIVEKDYQYFEKNLK